MYRRFILKGNVVNFIIFISLASGVYIQIFEVVLLILIAPYVSRALSVTIHIQPKLLTYIASPEQHGNPTSHRILLLLHLPLVLHRQQTLPPPRQAAQCANHLQAHRHNAHFLGVGRSPRQTALNTTPGLPIIGNEAMVSDPRYSYRAASEILSCQPVVGA